MLKEYPNSEIFKYVAEEIAEGKTVQLRVKGTSMLPFLRDGDFAILVPFDQAGLKVGDVVLFTYRKKVLLHRIIRRKGDNLVLKGDGIRKAKETITTQHVIALMKQIIRKNGKKIKCNTLSWYFLFYVWHYLRFFQRYLLILHNMLRNLFYKND